MKVIGLAARPDQPRLIFQPDFGDQIIGLDQIPRPGNRDHARRFGRHQGGRGC